MIDQQIPLGQVPVKRVRINHNDDVLSLKEKIAA